MSDFEAELIHHAAPTLLGRKQSNLFSPVSYTHLTLPTTSRV